MQPLEQAEETVGALHVKTCSVIFDKKDGVLPLVSHRSNVDVSRRLMQSVFNGMADQIDPDLPQQTAITQHSRKRALRPLNLAPRLLRLQVRYDFANELIERNF